MNANSLAHEYATATEWNLATLSELHGVKSTSKHRLSRQEDICYKMLLVCRVFEPQDIGDRNSRVREILEASKTEPEGLRGALSRHVAWLRSVYHRPDPKKSATKEPNDLHGD